MHHDHVSKSKIFLALGQPPKSKKEIGTMPSNKILFHMFLSMVDIIIPRHINVDQYIL